MTAPGREVPSKAFLAEARKRFHATLFEKGVLSVDEDGVPSIADRKSKKNVAIAIGVTEKLGREARGARLAGQASGNTFEVICEEFLKETFLKLIHLRPGKWHVSRTGGRLAIANYDQYSHLRALDVLARGSEELRIALGSDYAITPDIVIWREPEEDEEINAREKLVDGEWARLTSLRKVNKGLPILHASVSCKWTLRSDRAQNVRSEALNLVRNRKGPLPHVVAVTGDPWPSRIASLALGTGDIDCVYHFALPELRKTLTELDYEDSADLIETMVGGKRLRDITDLPLDLVV